MQSGQIQAAFQFIRRWGWLLVLATLLYGMVAYLLTARLPAVYRAQTILQVAPASAATADVGAIVAGERLAATYAQIIVQPATLEGAAQRLGQGSNPENWDFSVTAEPIRDTQLIDLQVEAPSPGTAITAADTVAQTFIDANRQRQVARFAASKANLEQQIADLDAQIKLEEAGAANSDVLSRLRQSLSALVSSYEGIRLVEAQSSDTVAVIQPARAGSRPVRPRPLANAAAAALIGLVMAGGAALLLQALDDRLNTQERVTAATSLPVLAAVTSSAASNGSGPLVLSDPQAPAAEAYRVLRTNLRFAGLDHALKTLAVVSSEPGEGKSTTAANLAASMALAGQRVILVDSDLRRPHLHTLFGIANNVGLTNALIDGIDGHLQATNLPNLQLLTSGPQPPNPSELLGSERMTALLQELGRRCDIVVLDTPPVLAVSDAAIVANQSDGALLVVDATRTRRATAGQSCRLLQAAGAHAVGAVLNRLPARSLRYDQYYQRPAGSA